MIDRRARRQALATLGALAAAGLTDAIAQPRTPLEATPRDSEGPFYPRDLPPDADNDLTRVAGRSGAPRGTPLLVSGRVLATDGTALAGARIELWQCDAGGYYHHVGGDAAQLDPNFQGYGVMVTNAAGHYSFKTIQPVAYGGRPPHLHFKLAHATVRPLTTQIYPRGDSQERGMGWGTSSSGTRSRLVFVTAPAQGGGLTTSYDFVLVPA